LVNKDEFVAPRQGQQVGQEVIVRGARTAMNNHQRGPMPYRRVIDQDTIGINEALLQEKNILRARSSAAHRLRLADLAIARQANQKGEHETADGNEECLFHGADYSSYSSGDCRYGKCDARPGWPPVVLPLNGPPPPLLLGSRTSEPA